MDLAKSKDKPTRLLMFRQMIVEPHKEIYGLAVSGMDDENLSRYLDQSESQENELRQLSNNLPDRLYRTWKSFALKFPDMKSDVTLYIAPAPQNAIGGWVRPFGNRVVVIFGFSTLARIVSELGFAVFVHLELTHLYQAQVNPEFRAMTARYFMKESGPPSFLYQLMWLEGLADYVSRWLNPKAQPGDVFNLEPADEIRARLPELARKLRVRMDASDRETIGEFVFGGNEIKGIPRKTGYYIGMLIAEQLGRTHSVKQLLRLGGKTLHRLIETSLRELESRFSRVSAVAAPTPSTASNVLLAD